MRECTKCGETKDDEAFAWKVRDVRRQSHCKVCTRRNSKSHYERNKSYYVDKALKRKTSYKIRFYKFLETLECVDCGISDPRVLEFDHISEKTANVSEMLNNQVAWEKLMAEIAKCDVVCSNCHAIRTAASQGWYAFTS